MSGEAAWSGEHTADEGWDLAPGPPQELNDLGHLVKLSGFGFLFLKWGQSYPRHSAVYKD